MRAIARSLSKEPYRSPEKSVPEYLLKLDYDAHRDIRFKPARSIWRDKGLPFQIQLFHLGLYFNRPVAINFVEKGVAHPFAFDPSLFDYGRNHFPEPLPPTLGYAGLRVHNRINRKDYFDEVIVFVGASYFRAVAKHLDYGLSARGIAIDTASDAARSSRTSRSSGSSSPTPRAKQIEIYALLDGPSVTGAYRFVVTPGADTITSVQASLFARSPSGGSASRRSRACSSPGRTAADFGDFRPRVHDSDGLLMHTATASGSGGRCAIPMHIETQRVPGPQSPRFRAAATRARLRRLPGPRSAATSSGPSAWVEPVGDWGPGSVRADRDALGQTETNDNIVAFWQPQQSPNPGEPLELAYRLHWYADDPTLPPSSRTLATRVGAIRDSEATRFVIDFGQAELAKLPAGAVVTANVSASPGGIVSDVVTQRNDYTHGWRVAFKLGTTDAEKPVELRCFLATEGRALTETWTYRWTP